MLLIEVEDYGIGVPQHMLTRLFRPFAQTQRRAGGTGLGLYSLALRIQELKGFYGIRNHVDCAGSVFYFALPFKVDESQNNTHSAYLGLQAKFDSNSRTRYGAQAISEKSNIVSQDRILLSSNGRPVVLLVDDSAPILKLLQRALEKSELVVETASDGFSALNLMKKKLYTAVIMDVEMPVMDGIESIRQIREWEHSQKGDGKHQCILCASASPDELTRSDAISAGSDMFAVKPLGIPDLLHFITCAPQYDV
jgi:CheY-like chemotaxis protein